MKNLLLSAATLLLGSSPIYAQEAPQLDAHEHGAVEINLAVDGSTVFIELESPAMNIVGFEHPPESADDKASVARAEQLLASASEMFGLPGQADCEVHKATAEWVGDDEHGEGHEEEHEGEEHAEDQHGPDEHEEEEHGEAIHSEFHAEYEFHCGDMGSLDKMEVHLLERFGGIEEIRIQAILPSGQTALELTAQSPVIELQ